MVIGFKDHPTLVENIPWDAKVEKELLRQPRQWSRLDQSQEEWKQARPGRGHREWAQGPSVCSVNGNFLEGLAKIV